MSDSLSLAMNNGTRASRRGRPRKHDDAYGEAARARISVRNYINWTYARRGAEVLGFAVVNSGPRPIAVGPPQLRSLSGTTVLTEIGRTLEAIGHTETIDLAHRVARQAEAAGLDANRTAKLIRQLRGAAAKADARPVDTAEPPTLLSAPLRSEGARLAG